MEIGGIHGSQFYQGAKVSEAPKETVYQAGESYETDKYPGAEFGNIINIKYDLAAKDADGNYILQDLDEEELDTVMNLIQEDYKARFGEAYKMVFVQFANTDKVLSAEANERMKEKCAEMVKKGRDTEAPNTYIKIEEALWTPGERHEYDISRFDDKNELRHSFASDKFQFDKEFDKYAVGYAKYLNKNIDSAYDDVVFRGFESDEAYKKQLIKETRNDVDQILSYFYLNNASFQERDTIREQFADAIVEYAHQIAEGDRDISHVKSKITINGSAISVEDLFTAQKILKGLNDTGIMGFRQDEHPEYWLECGENLYQSATYAQLGIKKSEMKWACDKFLSKDAAEMVKKVYEDRERVTIYSQTSPNEAQRRTHEMFSKLDYSSKENLEKSYQATQKQWDYLRSQKPWYTLGYTFSATEKLQHAFVEKQFKQFLNKL